MNTNRRRAIEQPGLNPRLFKENCPCCRTNVPPLGPRTCPFCGHGFGGRGWRGLHQHWANHHRDIEGQYQDFVSQLCNLHELQVG